MSLEQACKKIPCFIGSFELTSCHLTCLLFFDLTSVDAQSACSAKVSCYNKKAIMDENTKLLQHFVVLVHFERVSQKIIIARLRSHYQAPEFVFVRKGNRSSNCPDTFVTGVYYRSRTVRVIAYKHEILIDVLEGIVNNSQHLDDATLTQASGLLQYLNSFLFCLLVFVFGKILSQSSVLYDVLQNRSTDFSYGVGMITNFAEFLSDMRTDEAFHNSFESTVAIVGQPSSRSGRKHNYMQLYFQVIDNTVAMLNDRFADCKHFAFLVNPNFFAKWKAEFPADNLQLLKSKYGPLFNIQLLQSQLLFIYRDNDFYKKSSVEVLNYLYEFGLQESLPEVVKLLKLNSAIAVSSASVERSFSCLRRVKTYLLNKMDQERLGSLCRISIHKDLLKELEDKKKLHDLIAEKFIEKPRRLHFLYK